MSADVIDALRDLRRSLSRAATSAFAGTGVGGRQVVVLRELRHAGQASQAGLARATATDPASMMRTLDALERRGWVVRAGCADDRRCKLVSLTAAGRRALAELDAPYEALRALANRALSRDERAAFCAAAAKMAAALDAASAPTPDDSPQPRRTSAGRRTENR
jgi:MarR family transcriptional regulator for hemolysin